MPRLRTILLTALLPLPLLAAPPTSTAPAAPPLGHVTGIGGVFIKSKDPKALRAWYQANLGIALQPWGGAKLDYDTPNHPPAAAWMAFSNTSNYMAPSSRDFMLDFAVDNLDAVLARLKANNVKILGRDDSDPLGSYAWILDPDDTKIELWQAKKH
jgi:predicted enzyme related to lactoylglutathione lyase